MGYEIKLRKAEFQIPASKALAAQKAVAKLWRDMPLDPRCRGGNSTKRHYSWMNGWENADKQTLPQQIEAWGYKPETSGYDIVGIGLDPTKIGQEEILWETLAPFVDAGSFIEIEGEDGDVWQWQFDGKSCVKKELGNVGDFSGDFTGRDKEVLRMALLYVIANQSDVRDAFGGVDSGTLTVNEVPMKDFTHDELDDVLAKL